MTDLLRQTPATAPESNIGPPLPLPGPTVVCDLVRADDNLSVTVFMYAMDKVPTRTGWTLAPAPGKTGTIIVKLSAQHIMEYADTPDQVAPPQAAPVYGPSSLVVFSVPPGTPPIELSVRGILEAIANLPLQVASGVPTVHAGSGALRETGPDDGTVLATRLRRTAARAIDPASRLTVETPDVPPGEDDSGPGQTPLPGPPPASSATALAVPSRLRMSPAGGDTRFRHAAAPVERIGSVELWHSRLSVRQADGSHVEAEVPAVVFGAITSSTTE
ncbi:MAG TPA: hypothetical protein VFU35_03255, partial [Jatrophihabitans sp.]|nr:hypothetical protein [Jatrophihabitans sp.]